MGAIFDHEDKTAGVAETGKLGESWPYKMTNLLGLVTKTGHRTKQSRKQMKAARLQAPNINIRSHRLTR